MPSGGVARDYGLVLTSIQPGESVFKGMRRVDAERSAHYANISWYGEPGTAYRYMCRGDDTTGEGMLRRPDLSNLGRRRNNVIADGSRPCDALASADHADKESCCGPRLGRVIAEFTPTEQLNLVRLDDPWNFHSLSEMVRDAQYAGRVSASWARLFNSLLDDYYGGRWAAKVRAFYNGERETLPGRPRSVDQRRSHYHTDGRFAKWLCRLIGIHFDGALRVHGYVAGKVRMRHGVFHAEAAVCTANAAFVRTKIYDEEVCTRFWYLVNLRTNTPDEHAPNAPVKAESRRPGESAAAARARVFADLSELVTKVNTANAHIFRYPRTIVPHTVGMGTSSSLGADWVWPKEATTKRKAATKRRPTKRRAVKKKKKATRARK